MACGKKDEKQKGASKTILLNSLQEEQDHLISRREKRFISIIPQKGRGDQSNESTLMTGQEVDWS